MPTKVKISNINGNLFVFQYFCYEYISYLTYKQKRFRNRTLTVVNIFIRSYSFRFNSFVFFSSKLLLVSEMFIQNLALRSYVFKFSTIKPTHVSSSLANLFEQKKVRTKELNSHRIGLVHQHGRRFIVL